MTDKVQKIKEWISKTQDGLMDAQGNFEYPEHEGAYNILCNLGAYIDSLQEEPSKFDAAIQEGDNVRYNEDLGCRVNLSQLKRVAKKEEPVSEDLKKAAEQDVCEAVNTCSAIGIPNDHIPSWVQDAMVNEFIHGAQWKDKQLMAKAVDVTVHSDAGGYPYIPQIEFYDYDKDIPLAKRGDKVKILVIKQE